jgi:uncharacterized protein
MPKEIGTPIAKILQFASSRPHPSCVIQIPRILILILVLSFSNLSLADHVDYERSLVLAAENGSKTNVERAVRNGANVNSIVKVHGYEELTPLMAACLSSRLDILEFLLRNGAEIDLRTSHRETALIIASAKGDIETVEFLLKHGANADIQDNTGKVAAIRAAERGNFSVVKLLTKEKTPTGLPSAMLIGSAREGNVETLKEMIRKGANLNAEAEGGGTALMAASVHCKARIVSILLRAGANVNYQTSIGGETALHWARDGGCLEVIKVLINAGANPNIKDTGFGWTPLMWAANDGDINSVKLLLQNGSNPNIESGSGETAENLAKGAVARGMAEEDLIHLFKKQ